MAAALGTVINKKKVAEHFTVDITDEGLSWQRDEQKIADEAALDGICVIRTSLPVGVLGTGGAVESYQVTARFRRQPLCPAPSRGKFGLG